MNQVSPSRRSRRRLMPIWQMVVCHVFALGLALILFALPHHVIPRGGKTVSYPANQPGNDAAQTQQPQNNPQATGAPEVTSWWDEMFTDTPYSEGNLHVGRNTRVEITETLDVVNEQNYFVADVYVRDLTHLVGVFANDQVGRNIREEMESVAERTGSVVLINGDYYGGRSGGVCARNGMLYLNDELSRDVCVLYKNGVMETFSYDEVNIRTELANGAYHIWNFGPWLIKEDGTARTDFSDGYSDISDNHPRTAIGYIEPGHYLLVVVDGRSAKADGMTLPELAQLMQSLGCKEAYNMDGGQTSQMMLGTELVNNPFEGGRKCSDYIAVVD